MHRPLKRRSIAATAQLAADTLHGGNHHVSVFPARRKFRVSLALQLDSCLSID
jgi:hypothetical protein